MLAALIRLRPILAQGRSFLFVRPGSGKAPPRQRETLCPHLQWRSECVKPILMLRDLHYSFIPATHKSSGVADGVLDWPGLLGFGLTFAKVPLAMLGLFFAITSSDMALSALIACAIVLDILDGVVFGHSSAASNKQVRERRRILDSCLDRFLMFSILIPSVFVMRFPIYVFAVVTARELAVWIVTVLPFLNAGFVHKPNLPSKIGATLSGVMVIVFSTMGVVPVSVVTCFICFSAIGILLYVIRPERI